MFRVIIKNKEWLFSGVGLVVLTSFFGFFFQYSGKNQPPNPNPNDNSSISQTQSGSNSHQAGRDVVIYNYGITPEQHRQSSEGNREKLTKKLSLGAMPDKKLVESELAQTQEKPLNLEPSSPPSYIKQDDYIINKKENLTWTNDIVFMSWNDALQYSENAEFMGNNNWRLPTKNELLKIAKYAHPNPSFFNSDNNWFWSKESADRFSTTRKAWLVNGGNATDYKYKEEKEYRKEFIGGEYAVRLVRFNN